MDKAVANFVGNEKYFESHIVETMDKCAKTRYFEGVSEYTRETLAQCQLIAQLITELFFLYAMWRIVVFLHLTYLNISSLKL